MIGVVMALFVITSCDVSNIDEGTIFSNKKVPATIKAEQFDEGATKTVRNQDKSVSWMPEDAITVVCGTDIAKFTSTNTETAQTASFNGELLESTVEAINNGTSNYCVWGLYPYDENVESDGTYITTTLPAQQTGVVGTFDDDLFIALAQSDNFNLSFYNVCSGFKFSITQGGITSITIRGNNNEDIAGKVRLTFVDGKPKAQVVEGVKTITLTPEEGAFQVGKDYYFVMLPTEFTQGFSVSLEGIKKTGVFAFSNSVSFPRSKFVNKSNVDANVEYVAEEGNIYIPDANFKAYLVQNFDKSNDGEISYAEALDVTEIRCDSKQISSLQGIEYFSNLTILWCEKNKLTSLDLSNNSALIKLYCRNNQLTSLNVTHNLALTHLYCSSNKLSRLDVSNNLVLSRLDCEINELKTIDVTNNKELTMMGCGYNQLTSIDISQNVQLTWFQCGGSNKLTGLDVSNNTLLTTLRCYSNGLSALDISNNTLLSQLWCWENQLTELDVTHNTVLKELDCNNNQLTELDVTSCTILEKLNCRNNPLESINASGTALIQFDYDDGGILHSLDMHNCESLAELGYSIINASTHYPTAVDIRGCRVLNKLSCVGVITGLGECSALTHLRYGGDVSYLDLTANTALIEVSCSGTFTNLNVNNLSSLTALWVGNNQLSEFSVSGCTSLLTLAIQSVSHLNSVVINGCAALNMVQVMDSPITSLTINDCSSLENLYYAETSLTSLDVSDCPSLTSVYCLGDELISIDISRTGLSHFTHDDECSKVKTFLAKECLELQSVTINSPYLELIDVTGCTSLSALKCTGSNQLTSLDVSTNTALTSLSCGSNQLSSLDVSNNTALTSLSCDSNQLSSLDVSKNTALTSLSCSTNQLSSLDVSNNTALTKLWCNANQLTSLVLGTNTSLTSIECDNNQLPILDVSNNTALTKLHCKFNLLTSLDVSNNLALTELFVFGNMNLSEIWLKTGQTIATINYTPSITTIKYKD